jgi:UDP-N-acetylglucosamine--N-acetylmuramyl-(pentapeptide) pyrophosphoryl-undecaprenol N-acetylglucosamine transferase
MKVLITGGHFSPAYSIIAELKKRGHKVMVAGRKYPFEGDPSISYEYQLCEKEHLPFYEVKTGRFQRKFTSYTVSSLLKTPAGFIKAVKILRQAKPDLVMTFGGYIGLPISFAAAFLGIPVVLHEQTQGAGLASKLISRIASKICISFEDSKKFFNEKKTIFTGNPLRKEIFNVSKNNEIAKKIKTNIRLIYITGGSTGSHSINLLIEKIVKKLLSDFTIIHQTGDSLKFNDFERLNTLRESFSENEKNKYILRKFIYPEEIGYIFKYADLVISRAGANIIFEIMATRRISLLFPLPHGQTSEQLENAKLIASLGIGEYITESDPNPDFIIEKIQEMIKNEKNYERNMGKTDLYLTTDAASKIADVIEFYGKKDN